MCETDLIHDRIAELRPRIIGYSNFVLSTTLDREDIQQEMILALLERAAVEPSFSEQADAYLMRYALWSGKHAAEKMHSHENHAWFSLDDQKNPVTIYEIMPTASYQDPAEIIEQNEDLEALLDAVTDLTTENQPFVKMLYLGYSETEIAKKLGISKPAVTARKKKIAQITKRE